MDNIISLYSDILEDTRYNMYTESYKEDIDSIALYDAQASVYAISDLVYKIEESNKLNLYGEAVGGVFVAIMGFFKSAIALLLKIVLGFKGVIAAIIIGFIVRYILKRRKGGVSTYGGGGGGGGSTSDSTISSSGNDIPPGEVKSFCGKNRKNIVESIKRNRHNVGRFTSGLGKNSSAEEVARAVIKDLRDNIDGNNGGALGIPESLSKIVLATVTENIKNNRGFDGQPYFNSGDIQVFTGLGEAHAKLKTIYDVTTDAEVGIAEIIADMIANFDSVLVGAIGLQTTIILHIGKLASNKQEFGSRLQRLVNAFGNISDGNLKLNMTRELTDLNQKINKSNLDTLGDTILKAMRMKHKPKKITDYIKIREALEGLKAKSATTPADSSLRIEQIARGDELCVVDVSYGDDLQKGSEVRMLREIQNIARDDGFNESEIKRMIDEIMAVGNEIKTLVNDLDLSAVAVNGEGISKESVNSLLSSSVSMVGILAMCMNFTSATSKNYSSEAVKKIKRDVKAAIATYRVQSLLEDHTIKINPNGPDDSPDDDIYTRIYDYLGAW